LIEALQAEKAGNAERDVRAALHRIGPPAIPAVVDLLSSEDIRTTSRAHAALIEMGPKAAEAVAALLTHDSPRVRLRALEALGHFGAVAKGQVPALTRALDDKDAAVAARAAWTLGLLRDEARGAIPALLAKARAGEDAPRTMALRALAQ